MEIGLRRNALCARAERACVREASVCARQRACVKAVLRTVHVGASLGNDHNQSLTIMSKRFRFQLFAAVLATQGLAGCSRFVWSEEPFTPDPAPATEVVAAAGDTTYVYKNASYYLLAQQRNALWNRQVVDDVAWRYRALFSEAPPLIAIRLDTAATTSDSATTWRGVPLARVAPRPRPSDTREAKRIDRERQEMDDSVRARLFAGPMLAATVAETWLKARTVEATRASDGQPGGPEPVRASSSALPAWIEAGALRILGSSGAAIRAAAELRAEQKGIVPLATLFTVGWQRTPNALEIVRAGTNRFEMDDEDMRQQAAARSRARHEPTAGASPVFIAQSVSVLTFLNDRDPGFVARLADALPRGNSVATVLATSTKLPHDVASLDAEWRKWLERTQKKIK